MTWTDPAGAAQRELRWTFTVQGPGVGAMAEAIDSVIGEQFGRLADHLDDQD